MRVYQADGQGGYAVYDCLEGAKVGRWTSQASEVPDRCFFCLDPETLTFPVADSFVEGRTGIRYGLCRSCRASARVMAEVARLVSPVEEPECRWINPRVPMGATR
jgi:hypothetical protein